MALQVLSNIQNGRIIFQLSEHKSWLMQGTVANLNLKSIGVSEPLEISKITALNLEKSLPALSADGKNLVEGVDGICRVKGAHPTFSYDVSQIPGAHSAVCEISKPNSWFEHYSGTLRDREISKHALFTPTLNKLSGRAIPLSFAGIKEHGFYQIKIAALDKDGKVIGYFSDPLNFQI